MKTKSQIIRPAHGGACRLATVVLVATYLLWISSSPSMGEATFSQVDPSGFSNLIANPNDYPSWDLTTITYKFDPSFTATWPNPAVANQVRLAFQQWDAAFATPDGAIFSYNRANGFQNFGDIRSVALHEIGHVLGFQHPDQAAAVNRNYVPDGMGGLLAASDTGTEVLRSWINPGDYNNVLSHDELNIFDYAYGHDLNFTEVSGATPADIVISSYTAGVNNWAVGGWSGVYRNGADHSQGVRITSGTIQFNDSSGQLLGFKTLGQNWDYQNVGVKPTRAFEVRTSGTPTTTPLFHYDNSGGGGANRFDSFTVASAGSNNKDDLIFTWSNPHSGDLPSTEIIHVGLEQDVWDWNVVSAKVRHPDGTTSNAPVIGMHDWSNTVVVGTPAAPAVELAGTEPQGTAPMTDMLPTRTLARGIRLAASDTPLVISQLAVAVVTDFDLMLDDLNRTTMQELSRFKLLEPIAIDPVQMEPGGDFYIVLEGGTNGLPKDILEKGNFMIFDHPEMLDQELFLYARTSAGDAIVGNYGLLGIPANIRVPEPMSLALLVGGGLAVLARRRQIKARP